MALVYPDNPERPPFFINPYKMDATKQWLVHYGNYLYLKFIHDNTKSGLEKRQANQEIQKADKKMKYWSNMQNFDLAEAEKGKKELHKKWNITDE